MPEYEKLEEITENVKDYVATNCKLIKLQVAERSSVIGSGLISTLLIGITIFLLILFISLGLGFYLSARIGDTYSGFAIVAGFYLLIGIILIVGRKTLVEKPMRDKIIRKLFSSN